MDEKSVCANIERLVSQLNGELKAAHELGLKVSVTTKPIGLYMQTLPEWVKVRIWREIKLLEVSTDQGDSLRAFQLRGKPTIADENP